MVGLARVMKQAPGEFGGGCYLPEPGACGMTKRSRSPRIGELSLPCAP
jgi:hypothetical protein